MKIEVKSFKTKVARRIVFLFLLCALLPASTLGALGYWQVRTELQTQRSNRLNAGLSGAVQGLIERIQSIQAEQSLLAQRMLLGASGVAADDLHRVTDVSLVIGSDTRRIIGTLASLPSVSDEVLASLQPGEAVLMTPPGSGPDHFDILMAAPLDRDDASRGTMWVRADPDSLFSSAQVFATGLGALELDEQSDIGFCIFDPTLAPLMCAGALRPWLTGDLPVADQMAADSLKGPLQWTQDGTAFTGRFRRAFLRTQFRSESWTLVLAESDLWALAPLAEFRVNFFKVIAITLLLVLGLASLQVSRSLEPLAKLKKGTMSIAAKDFTARVRIHSGDEFEDLADSFNNMAERVGGLVDELETLSWSTITTLARTIDAKSPWTAGHSERVARMSLSIAQILGLDQEDLDTIHRGGLLHDIGKIGVPVHILDKPGKLNEEEAKIMQDHVIVGARILEPLTALSAVMPIVLQHHERVDGSGYPKGLTGEQMHPLARIVAVADAYDAIQSDRPYRSGRSSEQTAQIIVQDSGTDFDPEIVEAFLEVMALGDKPPSGWERQPLRAEVQSVESGG
ncbi:MAG: HD-GYP domain-containing protein [Gemmatimonadetes bacterium]|nr:HD-GYP domain-containing protein [Gemmatimonadota bacterium]